MNIRVFIFGTVIGGAIYSVGIITLSLLLTKVIKDFLKYLLAFPHFYALRSPVAILLIVVTYLVWRFFTRKASSTK